MRQRWWWASSEKLRWVCKWRPVHGPLQLLRRSIKPCTTFSAHHVKGLQGGEERQLFLIASAQVKAFVPTDAQVGELAGGAQRLREGAQAVAAEVQAAKPCFAGKAEM